jgi:hypothetical protein
MGFQVLGLLMAGFGVVNATAALVNSAPYLRFGGSGTVRVWPPAVMLVGINWYALMLAAGHFAAAQYIPLISSMGALAQAASVIGWRMWIHYLVLQSHQT